MDLSIITVTWNSEKFIGDQLSSVFASDNSLSKEVFVVDNASTDGTVKRVSQDHPEVHLIPNVDNKGFAKANNQAVIRSTGRYVLLLNPDMRVFPDTFSKIAAWMDAHPRVGVAGIHLVDQNGATVPHVRRFPKLWDQVAILLKLPHLFPRMLNTYLMADFDYTQEAKVDSVRGSFFVIRREVIQKLGGLDERYFIWFEEVDYCRQVMTAGWDVMYTPVAKCVDYVGRSFALVSGYKKQKFFTKSMLTYFRKWHPRQAWVIALLRPFALALAWLAQLASKK